MVESPVVKNEKVDEIYAKYPVLNNRKVGEVYGRIPS